MSGAFVLLAGVLWVVSSVPVALAIGRAIAVGPDDDLDRSAEPPSPDDGTGDQARFTTDDPRDCD